MLKKLSLLAAMLAAVPANAALVFVGQWQVDQGPDWLSGPLAYTGQEAAALLFGGNPGDYQISTAGPLASQINNLAWYSVIGVGGGWEFAQDYSNKYDGLFYGPTDGYDCCGQDYLLTNAASAYVTDNAVGSEFTNYAFIDNGLPAVPEPDSWALMIAGFGLVGAAMRKRKAAMI
jgi:hypothetical protein